MSRTGWTTRAIAMLVVLGLPFLGGIVTSASGQTTPDRSEIVIVLDFSGSILRDKTNRNRFAAALERIADRVDQTSADLQAGDARVSIVQFATRARDRAGCVDLRLLASAQEVTRFADCIRGVAADYRSGGSLALRRAIGVDTNYVAAMQRAAAHLPADSVRPALILLTDGKHDVRGVPVSRVIPTRNQLFGSRPTFALLPVGMGLQASQRGALQRGLESLRVIRGMPACVSGATFEWPQVVFTSADQAGDAVALALQDVTCTFTVAPTPTPSPTPTPPPPAPVRSIKLTPGDAKVEIEWAPPATSKTPIVDFQARCRTGGSDWIQSQEGVSLATRTTIEGLTNGVAYQCEVASIDAASVAVWAPASAPVTPIGPPAAPGKPGVLALDHAIRVSIQAVDPASVTGHRFECSSDSGKTWSAAVDVEQADVTTAQVGGLTNGIDYVCHAFAINASGTSAASPNSDIARPCGSPFECNPIIPIALGALGVVLGGGILVALVVLYRGRTRGYVVAVVDVVHTANLGSGSSLGVRFMRRSPRGALTGIAPDRSDKADLKIRFKNDRFTVTDSVGKHVAASGERFIVVDSIGQRHDVVLTSFSTRTAAATT